MDIYAYNSLFQPSWMLTKDDNIINISCSSYGSPGIGTYMDAYLEVITFWDAAKLILLLLGINIFMESIMGKPEFTVHCKIYTVL